MHTLKIVVSSFVILACLYSIIDLYRSKKKAKKSRIANDLYMIYFYLSMDHEKLYSDNLQRISAKPLEQNRQNVIIFLKELNTFREQCIYTLGIDIDPHGFIPSFSNWLLSNDGSHYRYRNQMVRLNDVLMSGLKELKKFM